MEGGSRAALAIDFQFVHQGKDIAYRTDACVINLCRPLEADHRCELAQGRVDFPLQKRRTGRRARHLRAIAVKDNDRRILAGQTLRQKRAGNTCANDDDIAFEILREGTSIIGNAVIRLPQACAAPEIEHAGTQDLKESGLIDMIDGAFLKQPVFGPL